MRLIWSIGLVLGGLASGVTSWDLGKVPGYKALPDRPQETATDFLVCHGATPAPGCTTDQADPSKRTWQGYWDYINVAGGYPQGPARTKANEGLITWEGSNGVPILVFIYWGLYALIMIVYKAYKMLTSIERDEGAGHTAKISNGDVKITGYKDSGLGTACFYVYHTYTAVFVIIYLTLIIDTYWSCEFRGPDNLCFRGANPILGNGKFALFPAEKLIPSVNQNVFMWCWTAGMVWALWNFFYGGQMANYFRTCCNLKEATHILCQRKQERVVMSKPSWWVLVSRSIGQKIGGGGENWFSSTSDVDRTDSDKPSFEFMCTQYAWIDSGFSKATAESAGLPLPTNFEDLVARRSKGISSGDSEKLLATLGPNSIPYRKNTWLELVALEFSSYLYIYQFTFFMVWLWFGGLVWCSPQMVVVCVCAAMSITITRKNQEKIEEIGKSGLNQTIEVWRETKYERIEAVDLVPGDVCKLNSLQLRDDQEEAKKTNIGKLPCDLIIIEGTCITDESALTGESQPVRKSAVSGNEEYNLSKHKKHTLFAGTTLTQATHANESATGIVSETGIRTEKGDLVSAILYPAEMVFEYDEELKVVFIFLSIYATFLFAISVYLQILISPLTWISVFAFACFTISQILPPLLPVALVIGHTNSCNRLKAKKILCVQPKRVAISGKIHAFCFDKTGTLTKQNLDFKGVHRVEDGVQFNPQVEAVAVNLEHAQPEGEHAQPDGEHAQAVAVKALLNERNASAYKYDPNPREGDMVAWGMASCHTVTIKAGDKTKVGNQVEVKMFEASGWNLRDKDLQNEYPSVSNGKETLELWQQFEFDHHSKTMSVVVRDTKTKKFYGFVKGAPETIYDKVQAKGNTNLPPFAALVNKHHSGEGCYMIGMSQCELTDSSLSETLRNRMQGEYNDSWTLEQKIAKAACTDVEQQDLSLIGLLMFRNECKKGTKDAMEKIIAGDIRPVMVTGDIAECGQFIAKSCGMIKQDTILYVSAQDAKSGAIIWQRMDGIATEQITTDQILQECIRTKQQGTHKIELAITGKCLTILTKANRVHELLLHTRIFARVSPNQKVQVVEAYMAEGYITGMCGDGGNDCGALRAAHAGIALSKAEASVVSPFTAQDLDEDGQYKLSAVVDVLCEGRCALVTSFAAYRFYITYGLNWSIVKTINFVYGVRMPISAYLTIDSICSWLCAWAITGALPLDTLDKYRPTSSLFAPNILWSVCAPWFVWMFLMTIMLAYEGGHADHVDMQPQLSKGVGYWELGDTWESTIFTYFQVCPLIWCGVAYSIGGKFRQPLYKNYAMLLVWFVIFLIYSIVILMEPTKFTAFFHIASNAHNGFNTESPVWMRYQFPRGCPDQTSTLAYNESVGLGSWRGALPPNCAKINAKVGTCGPLCNGTPESCVPDVTSQGHWIKYSTNAVYQIPNATVCTTAMYGLTSSSSSGAQTSLTAQAKCESKAGCVYNAPVLGQIAGMPTPGMNTTMRFYIWLTILWGMFFVFTWELYLNWKHVVPADWENEDDGSRVEGGKIEENPVGP